MNDLVEAKIKNIIGECKKYNRSEKDFVLDWEDISDRDKSELAALILENNDYDTELFSSREFMKFFCKFLKEESTLYPRFICAKLQKLTIDYYEQQMIDILDSYITVKKVMK
jgi:surfactin synthase thioesterase subunit